MSSLLLPFAKHIPTGKTVAPEEVDRGNACDCECLFCGAPMQARQGSEKAYHFAHQPKKVDDDHPCPASFARCIFWMAKRILEEGSEISLPEYKVVHSDSFLGLEKEYLITEAKRLPYRLTNFPNISDSPSDKIRIEISINGHPLNLVMADSKHYLRPNEATVRISMNFLADTYKEQSKGFLSAMRELMLDSVQAKEWLFHSKSRQDQRKREFEDLVQAKRDLIEAKKQAKLQEANRANELREQRLRERSDPQIAENIARRLNDLIRIAKYASEAGAKSGWQCCSCYAVRTTKLKQCIHCGQSESRPFDFSEDNMSNLENKFYCGNYAAKSLAAAPILIF